MFGYYHLSACMDVILETNSSPPLFGISNFQRLSLMLSETHLCSCTWSCQKGWGFAVDTAAVCMLLGGLAFSSSHCDGLALQERHLTSVHPVRIVCLHDCKCCCCLLAGARVAWQKPFLYVLHHRQHFLCNFPQILWTDVMAVCCSPR